MSGGQGRTDSQQIGGNYDLDIFALAEEDYEREENWGLTPLSLPRLPILTHPESPYFVQLKSEVEQP